ncbi:unnamed protein product [Prunus brigantina]
MRIQYADYLLICSTFYLFLTLQYADMLINKKSSAGNWILRQCKNNYKIFIVVNSKWLYLLQDYKDTMEGATLSDRQASAYICDAGEESVGLRKKLAAQDSGE